MQYPHIYSLEKISEMRAAVLKTIYAKIIADSISPAGVRLTSIEVRLPRVVLAELNTHKVFDRNSASSRAMPVEKQLRMIIDSLYLPFYFGANRSGMQAKSELEGEDLVAAVNNFMLGRDIALMQAVALIGGVNKLKDEELIIEIKKLQNNYPEIQSKFTHQSTGLHKQNANRVLEPYMWHTVLITATDWANFYALRCDHEAQPEIHAAALAIVKSHYASNPQKLNYGDWHLPYLEIDEKRQLSPENRRKVSTGRSARLSYMTQDGIRSFDKDIEMHDDLLSNGHMSPFGHIATPTPEDNGRSRESNLCGWHQYRKEIPYEYNFAKKVSPDRLLSGLGGDMELLDFVLSLER